jgi:hypothetical protein
MLPVGLWRRYINITLTTIDFGDEDYLFLLGPSVKVSPEEGEKSRHVLNKRKADG